MEAYILAVAGLGALILLTAWLPLALEDLPLSLPICCVGIGAALAAIPAVRDVVPRPDAHLPLVEHITEAVVVISLVGAGLKIDRPIGWRRWTSTWRLLGIAMPLTIVTLAALAVALIGLDWPTGLLLAAALAPTDPVLASDVQVGTPAEENEDETRFALTSEAGFNDGLAFPFVALAILFAGAGHVSGSSLLHWIAVDVVWKILVGATLGALIGAGLGWITFHLPHRSKLISRTGDGFVALGVSCLTYGLIEAADGYGFIGIFAAALALRSSHRDHKYHHKLHEFAEELERLLMMVLLVGFGATIAGGGFLSGLTWGAIIFVVVALAFVRPVAGWISLLGFRAPMAERVVISFFGIRGLGTAYYLAYAMQRGDFKDAKLVWATAALTVLLSVVMHGASAKSALGRLDRPSPS